jgi:hypothetical protein
VDTQPAPPAGSARLRLLVRLAVIAGVLAALHYGGGWLLAHVEALYLPLHERYGPLALGVVIAVYTVAMALPFVPGIEISLALLMLLGSEGVAVVYFSTLAALCLSFAVGRLIPLRIIARGCAWLQLRRTAALVRRLEPLQPEERLRLLIAAAPTRFVPFLLRHRYVAVAVAFNLPGNGLLGGGGGIALAAGISGLFRPPAYALMVALAISPIPLLVLWQGAR